MTMMAKNKSQDAHKTSNAVMKNRKCAVQGDGKKLTEKKVQRACKVDRILRVVGTNLLLSHSLCLFSSLSLPVSLVCWMLVNGTIVTVLLHLCCFIEGTNEAKDSKKMHLVSKRLRVRTYASHSLLAQ